MKQEKMRGRRGRHRFCLRSANITQYTHCTPAMCGHRETVTAQLCCSGLQKQTWHCGSFQHLSGGILQWEDRHGSKSHNLGGRGHLKGSKQFHLKKDKQCCDAKSKRASTTQDHADGRQHALVRRGPWRKEEEAENTPKT